MFLLYRLFNKRPTEATYGYIFLGGRGGKGKIIFFIQAIKKHYLKKKTPAPFSVYSDQVYLG